MSESNTPKLPKFFLPFFSLVAGVGPFAMDSYLPAVPLMAEFFAVDIVAINNTIPAYMVGYGTGQLFGGPISDKIGRKRVALIGLLIFMAATLLIVFAASVQQIQVFRILQAIGGGFSTVICMAAMRDVYPPQEAGRKFALVMMLVMAAPIIAPTLGAFLMDFGWQKIFVFLFFYALMVAFIYKFYIPETRFSEDKKVNFGVILNQYKRAITKRIDGKLIPLLYVLTSTFATSSVMIFLTNAPFVYLEYFAVPPKLFSVYFGAIVVVVATCLMISLQLMKRIHPHKIMLVGCVLQLIAMVTMLVLVVTGKETIYNIVPCLSIGIGLMGLINPNGSAVYISFYSELSGSATSINATSAFIVGAALGGLTSLFFDGTLLPIAAIMLLAAILCNVFAFLIPYPKEEWGNNIK